MRIDKTKKIIYKNNEAFQLFFEDELDKRLQYADWDELIEFTFGSWKRAIKKFDKERND